MAVCRCTVIAAELREARDELNVRKKPRSAPQLFITPTKVKEILKQGPIQQLFLCPCPSCETCFGCSADDRKKYYREAELAGDYATIYALLTTLNWPGLIYEFQKNQTTLDRRLCKENLQFLIEPLSTRFKRVIADDVIRRILTDQFMFFARPFEIRQNVESRIPADEALPIVEDEEPVGKGDSGKVYAFKILKDYKGEGFRNLKVRMANFSQLASTSTNSQRTANLLARFSNRRRCHPDVTSGGILCRFMA